MAENDHLLGIDLGSSSVKVSLVEAGTGSLIASCFEPQSEMPIHAEQPGWAEQEPEMWWKNTVSAIRKVLAQAEGRNVAVKAIGISYQMHGLVLLGENGEVLRPSIIWCDSRAVDVGNEMERKLGNDFCFAHLLNSPGNFTAAKLMWVKENEPDLFDRVHTVMLPGDYLAYRLSGALTTTASGLSEGIFWDFRESDVAGEVIDQLAFSGIPEIVPSFGRQGELTAHAAAELGLRAGIPITYRSGDQPNNAISLRVSEPGQVAATAGTSGVIYAVSDKPTGDKKSRVNTFLHPSGDADYYGILLCVNGTGIANSWIRRITGLPEGGYDRMNEEAAQVRAGSDGLLFYPFGNGAERMLGNKQIDASFLGLSFTRHGQAHLYRAVQEGVCFALRYGFDVLGQMGFAPEVIRASDANMFRSPLFCEMFTNLTGCVLEIYETDGARGAALAAGVGLGMYKSVQDIPLNKKIIYRPEAALKENYSNLYQHWKKILETKII